MAIFRDHLIRAHFEVHRDLTWAEILEPRMKEVGVVGDALEAQREAWNRYAEERDWTWWQNHSKSFSDAQLDEERMECIEKLGQLGMLRWQQDKNARVQQFQRILTDLSDALERPREEARERDERRDI